MSDWKYYNHMIIPKDITKCEHDLSKSEISLLWKNYPKAYLIMNIRKWDIEKESEWYYVIKDSCIELIDLKKKVRKQVEKGLQNYTIRLLDCDKEFEIIYETYLEACKRYEMFEPKSFEEYKKQIDAYGSSREIWGAFSEETGKMDGYSVCSVLDGYVDWNEAKFSPDALKLRVSDAMEYFIVQEYINNRNYGFVLSGQRSIGHATNVQEYDIKSFQFRRAYCELDVIYKIHVRIAIGLLYPFRRIIKRFESINVVHSICSLLYLEEIHRSYK